MTVDKYFESASGGKSSNQNSGGPRVAVLYLCSENCKQSLKDFYKKTKELQRIKLAQLE